MKTKKTLIKSSDILSFWHFVITGITGAANDRRPAPGFVPVRRDSVTAKQQKQETG